MARTAPITKGKTPIRPATKKQVVQRWLDSNYLSYTLEDHGEHRITIEEFLSMTMLEYPEAWLGDSVMHPAIALLAQKFKRSDVLVLSSLLAQKLYQVGMGQDTTTDAAPDMDIHATLMNEQKRWIVVPCTDASLQTVRLEEEFHGLRPKPVGGREKQRAAASKQGNAHGTHWGLLIVDKKNKVALWLDSLVECEETKDKKWKVKSMLDAGTAAGKVLLGIDAFLAEGLEEFDPSRRNFTASTLKHTPQQDRDNRSRDAGACGPFAFEILDHLFRQAPDAMDDIKALFPPSRREKTKFNSASIRKVMQQLIQVEAEASAPNAFNLDSETIRALLKPHLLVQAVRESKGITGQVTTAPGPVGPKSSSPGELFVINPGSIWTKEDKIALEEVEKDLLERPDAYRHVTDARLAPKIFRDYQKALIDDLGISKKTPGATDAEKALQDHDIDFLAMDDEQIDEWIEKMPYARLLDMEKKPWLKRVALIMVFCATDKGSGIEVLKKKQTDILRKSPPFSGNETKREVIRIVKTALEHLPAVNLRGRRQCYPDFYLKENFPQLQDDVKVDHARMTRADLRKRPGYNRSNHPSIHTQHKQLVCNDFTWRAIFYVEDGNSFTTADKNDCLTLWIQDSNIFTAGKDFTRSDGHTIKLKRGLNYTKIRERMRLQYETLKSVDGDREDKQDRHNKGQTSKSSSSKIDFAKISPRELRTHVTSDIKYHKSITKGLANDMTFRAILFVLHGNTFQHPDKAQSNKNNTTTDEDCETIWIRDTNVFMEDRDYSLLWDSDDVSRVVLRNGMNHQRIRKWMRRRYELGRGAVPVMIPDSHDDASEYEDPEADGMDDVQGGAASWARVQSGRESGYEQDAHAEEEQGAPARGKRKLRAHEAVSRRRMKTRSTASSGDA